MTSDSPVAPAPDSDLVKIVEALARAQARRDYRSATGQFARDDGPRGSASEGNGEGPGVRLRKSDPA